MSNGVSCLILFMAVCTGFSFGGEAYVAEGYFVVDAKALNVYLSQIPGKESSTAKRTKAIANITEDIGYLLTETNQLLDTLSVHGLKVQVRIRKLDFLTTDVFPANYLQNGNVITGGSAIKLFSDWLVGQKAHSTLDYDFALLWSGYDILGDTGIYTQGLANVGKICDPKDSVSVIEFNATYLTALITAHEFAHLLGASHDGIASDKVMSAANSPGHKHRWSFAECAANDIKEFLPLLSPNCLLKTNSASTKPATSWTAYHGRLFDHNAVCERAINDPRSYACLSSNLYNSTTPKGDPICQQLYCQLPGTKYCLSTFTSEGMICDNRKRCDNGKCVPDTSAASAHVDTECVLGDQKVLEIHSISFTGTCQRFVDEQGGQVNCYNSAVANLCCATCKKYKTTVKDCQYGDRSKQCVQIPKSSACAPQNAAICCYTCRDTVGKRSTDEDRHVVTIKDESNKGVINADLFKVKLPEVVKVPRLE